MSLLRRPGHHPLGTEMDFSLLELLLYTMPCCTNLIANPLLVISSKSQVAHMAHMLPLAESTLNLELLLKLTLHVTLKVQIQSSWPS